MNPSSANVAQFNSVIVPEAVLNTQSPIEGFGVFDVWRIVGGGSRASRGGVRKRGDPACSRRQAAVGQEVRSIGGEGRGVLRDAQLWRQGQNADVVVVDVIRDSEAAADRRLATGAGRIGESHTRAPIVLGGARLLK